MKIFIGTDHRGVTLKNQIVEELKKRGIEIIETKTQNHDGDDYPDFAFEVGENVVKNPEDLGILICGNGIGISIAANKVKNVRCARVLTEDDAFKARNHNGANIIALSAETEVEEAMKMIEIFINTPSASLEKHTNRIKKIIKYENGEYNEL